jgi:hypothetical protein
MIDSVAGALIRPVPSPMKIVALAIVVKPNEELSRSRAPPGGTPATRRSSASGTGTCPHGSGVSSTSASKEPNPDRARTSNRRRELAEASTGVEMGALDFDTV